MNKYNLFKVGKQFGELEEFLLIDPEKLKESNEFINRSIKFKFFDCEENNSFHEAQETYIRRRKEEISFHDEKLRIKEICIKNFNDIHFYSTHEYDTYYFLDSAFNRKRDYSDILFKIYLHNNKIDIKKIRNEIKSNDFRLGFYSNKIETKQRLIEASKFINEKDPNDDDYLDHIWLPYYETYLVICLKQLITKEYPGLKKELAETDIFIDGFKKGQEKIEEKIKNEKIIDNQIFNNGKTFSKRINEFNYFIFRAHQVSFDTGRPNFASLKSIEKFILTDEFEKTMSEIANKMLKNK